MSITTAASEKRSASSVVVSTPDAKAKRARMAIAPNAMADATTNAMPVADAARVRRVRGAAHSGAGFTADFGRNALQTSSLVSM